MAKTIEGPILTTYLDGVSSLLPDAKSLYIAGVSVEERSQYAADFQADISSNTTYAVLADESRSTMTFSVGRMVRTMGLRSPNAIGEFLDGLEYDTVYLDLTGLPHHVWVPLLKCIRSRGDRAFCVYVEPGDYQYSSTPTESTIFDLSERIDGVAPLPGFASLSSRHRDDVIFVPLLGFEGARLAFSLEAVQPRRENIFPIVGVPGFRPEYPFYTYLGNRLKLQETRSWKNVHFAAANCPFALYNVLRKVATTNQGVRMVIAAIGTKPHALGAILYCLDNQETTEILYDHPVRKQRRTHGASRVCLYDLACLG